MKNTVSEKDQAISLLNNQVAAAKKAGEQQVEFVKQELTKLEAAKKQSDQRIAGPTNFISSPPLLYHLLYLRIDL